MTNRTKLILFTFAAVLRLAATPALAQSFDADDGTNVLPFSSQPVATEIASRNAAVHAARRNGMDSYAMEPRPQSNSAPRVRMPVDSDDPAFTGVAALATTNCCSRKVTNHPSTKKVGRTAFAHFPDWELKFDS